MSPFIYFLYMAEKNSANNKSVMEVGYKFLNKVKTYDFYD